MNQEKEEFKEPEIVVTVFSDDNHHFENIQFLIETLNKHRFAIVRLVDPWNLDLTTALFSLLKKTGYRIEKKPERFLTRLKKLFLL